MIYKFRFILNLAFSVFEFFGGLFTNSVAIISDSIHDMGDALSIGISYFMERKSKKHADNKYTYGYIRYSVLGGVITTTILLVGSVLVIVGAVDRLFNPVEVNYSGMIIFAIFGVILNFLAAFKICSVRDANPFAAVFTPGAKRRLIDVPTTTNIFFTPSNANLPAAKIFTNPLINPIIAGYCLV